MYIPRHLHLILATLITQFPAIMVTGARQVSKSTLLKHIAQSQGEYYQYINFDDSLQLPQAIAEPMLFML
ncbi:AAA family ATPase, partial [Mycobacterium tuberculosis]|nr:AAA family ATPase [Mycobacterium tuberculosis]